MADIAFLLLIFFLVTTTIDMDKGLGMVLPAEGEELEINKKNILNRYIFVIITRTELTKKIRFSKTLLI